MDRARVLCVGVLSFLILTILTPQLAPLRAQTEAESLCRPPVLSRLRRHRIIDGETPASIAHQYNLIPETLIRLNPLLQKTPLPVGAEILIPPFNGMRLQVPQGATWKDLEEAYGIRADILFELNGCVKIPQVVFIPGTTWANDNPQRQNYQGLAGYPLPNIAQVGLRYGWQSSPINQERLFHSGLDLLAPVGTEVLSADGGEVVFVGQENAYGILIIVNYSDTHQTRYAHLSKVRVKVGQQVATGEVLGEVGATGRPDLAAPHLHFEVRYKSPVGWVAQDPSIHFQPANN